MTPIVPVNPTTGKPYVPVKKTGATTNVTDPNSNPYPNDPNARYVNGRWMDVPSNGRTPAQVNKTAKTAAKVGKTAFQKWLASNAPSKTPHLPFDPTKNWPDAPVLTPYPGLDTSTLPDGSEVPDTPAQAFKRTGASLLDPKQFANLEGTKAYQPIIDALTGQQSRLQGGIGQANGMLDKVYGDAGDASLRGAQIVKDSNAQANQSLTDLAARLAQVAGGDPTAAAAIGQTSGNQQAADSRFAAVAEQGQADQAAAAQRDLGIAKLGYKGATDSAISDLAQKVAQAKLDGSQAQGKAVEEALGFNSDQRTAGLNRDVSSLEARTAAALAAPQITAANLGIASTRQGLTLNAHTAETNDWTAINAGKRQQYLDAVTRITDKATAAQMKQALIKGQTPVAELALADPSAYAAVKSDLDQAFTTKTGPAVDPGTMYSQTIKQLHTAYPDSSSKAIKALALRYAQSQLPMWNTQHSKGQANSGKTWKVVKGAPALVKA